MFIKTKSIHMIHIETMIMHDQLTSYYVLYTYPYRDHTCML